MITHVVLMKFKDPAAAPQIRDMLLTLPAKIPLIQYYEVGVDMLHSERSFDLSLIARFNTMDDLNAYGTNPDHVEVLTYIRTVLERSIAVDYES